MPMVYTGRRLAKELAQFRCSKAVLYREQRIQGVSRLRQKG